MATKRKSKGRGSGEGSIYRRASDGKWVTAVSLGHYLDKNGVTKRRRKVIYGDTRREVAEKLTVLLMETQHGAFVSDQQSVAQYLNYWLDKVKRPKLRASTHQAYRFRIDRYILPHIGQYELAKLNAQHIQFMFHALIEDGLSPGSLRFIRAILRTALKHAIGIELITRNPLAMVEVPSVKQYHATILQPEEARRLLEAVRGDRLEALYTVALALGMRRGEIAALRWEDVDLAHGTLHVRRTLVRITGKVVSMPPKTEKGNRKIDLPAVVVTALRQHRFQQENEQRLTGSAWKDEGLVFTTPRGTALLLEKFGVMLQEHLARAGLPHLRFHDLRHSCASFLLAQGVPPKVVQEILGHSSIAITMDVYGHLLPGARRDAADKMDDLLKRRG
jgi:integrase